MTEGAADTRRDDLGLVEVGVRETQHAETSCDEQVLPAIVFDEPIPVVAPIELNDETRRGVIEVRPAHEPTLGIAKLGLYLRLRQPGPQQEPA